MEIKVNFLNKTYKIILEKEGDFYKIIINEKKYEVSDFTICAGGISFRVNGNFFSINYAEDKDKKFIAVDGEYYVFEPEKMEKKKTGTVATEKSNIVVSPMPGLLVKVPVKIGDKVQTGTTLAIVEAMKMQNELRTPIDGVVKKINYKEGEQVDAFVPIVELET